MYPGYRDEQDVLPNVSALVAIPAVSDGGTWEQVEADVLSDD